MTQTFNNMADKANLIIGETAKRIQQRAERNMAIFARVDAALKAGSMKMDTFRAVAKETKLNVSTVRSIYYSQAKALSHNS
jgi:hypothetical protein